MVTKNLKIMTKTYARQRESTRADARQRVRNRTCLDLRRVDARRRVMHIHEPVIDSAQAQVINNNNGGRGSCGGRKSTS